MSVIKPQLRIVESVGPSANDYSQLDQRTHAYKISDMYIGSDAQTEREEWLYDAVNDKIVNGLITLPQGVERLFIELMTNASDNVGRSRRFGADPGTIDVTMDRTTISVRNGGLPIPIEINSQSGLYAPEFILGSMLTSSNYDGDRHEAGRNGLGAKLVNIYSKSFKVEVYDAIRHWHYTQVWNNNMTVRGDPVIMPYNGTLSSVTIVYEMDFARFGYTEYPDDAFHLFARHCADISFTAKTSVKFNDKTFSFDSIKDYARMYYGELVNTAVLHYEWPPNTEVIVKKGGIQVSKDPLVMPLVELCLLDTPHNGSHVSFVNSMMTRDGGAHVEEAIKIYGGAVAEAVNSKGRKSGKGSKSGKGAKKEVKETKKPTITLRDIRPHISVIITVKLVNPKFLGQSKSKLDSPKPKMTPTEDEIESIMDWKLILVLHDLLQSKDFGNLTKTSGRRKIHVGLDKGSDANEAGGPLSSQCVAFITEGNSAMGYANHMISMLPSGRDFAGVIPIKGKLLNVMNVDSCQRILDNKELMRIRKLLNLNELLDYTIDANFNTLRYGTLVILADADTDGKHIVGLVLNFMYCLYPSLIRRGYVMYLKTPILRVSHGTSVLKFYTEGQYENWKNKTPNSDKWKHKYFKGLGSSSPANVKEDVSDPHYVQCIYDNTTDQLMKMAFDDKLADDRKKWIASWKRMLEVEEIKMQPISDFINHDLVEYGVANVHRSIPSLMDGLKPGQRKIMWAAWDEWKWAMGKTYTEKKVEVFSGHVVERTKYHHGPKCLVDTIINMAQDFVGANNLPYFQQDGMFGTRDMGGKDCADARYSFTRPEWWIPYVFRREDMPILEILVDEGDEIEPRFFLPIVPLQLINGARGIGSGSSTYIPNHNVRNIISWYRARLAGTELPIVDPYFEGFKGGIRIHDKRAKKNAQMTIVNVPQIDEDGDGDDDFDDQAGLSDDEIDLREEKATRSKLSLITTGNFRIKDGIVIVDELPIERWIQPYRAWLEEMVEAKKIKTFREQSLTNSAYFEITGFENPSIKSLKLQKSFGLTNMTLIDENEKPVTYDNTDLILETFYLRRLAYYQKRKDYILGKIKVDVDKLTERIRFIMAVKQKHIRPDEWTKKATHEVMTKMNFDHKLLKEVTLADCTEEDVLDLQNRIKRLNEEYESILATDIKTIWLRELDEFDTEYCKRNKIKTAKPTLKLVEI